MTNLKPYVIINTSNEREEIKMKKLTLAETPKTRTAFIAKWNADHVFRQKAKDMGFQVVFDTVIFPTGKVAGKNVK